MRKMHAHRPPSFVIRQTQITGVIACSLYDGGLSMQKKLVTCVLSTWLSLMLAACGGMAAPVQPSPAPTGVVVTLRVAGAEEYRIRLTDPDDITAAQKLLAGQAAPRIPNGQVVRGIPDVNVGATPGTSTPPQYSSPIRRPRCAKGSIQSLRRSPDGTRLASCGDDGAIMIWDVQSGAHDATLRHDRPYERMDITGLIGITAAQSTSLIALGAVEEVSG